MWQSLTYKLSGRAWSKLAGTEIGEAQCEATDLAPHGDSSLTMA